MWSVRAWAAASHERAIVNARSASTECSRRRIERDDVALFLADLTGRDGRHTASTAAEHPA